MEFKFLKEIEESQKRYLEYYSKKFNIESFKSQAPDKSKSDPVCKLIDNNGLTDSTKKVYEPLDPSYDFDDKSTDSIRNIESISITLPDIDACVIKENNVSKETHHTRISLEVSSYNDKLDLISVASSFLLDSEEHVKLYEAIENVASSDPEFILKFSMYSRVSLNVRSLANALLAYAIENIDCRHYVDKYFDAIITIPTDLLTTLSYLWKRTHANYIPKCVRPCFERKILSFSDYHLRKYRNKKVIISTSDDTYITMKRLIKLLHMKENRQKITKILEIRYPKTLREFYNSKLEGEFNPANAGKRIKFDTILTWETQISEKGNIAESWSVLLEKNAIPYSALLKNLRNICYAAMDKKYYQIVADKISNPDEIQKFRVFPIEYLTAYKALKDEVSTAIENRMKKIKKSRKKCKIVKKSLEKDYYPILHALNTAFKIATDLNVNLIPGRTIIILEVAHDREALEEIAQYDMLYALMIKTRCEYCELFLTYQCKYLCKIDLDIIDLKTMFTVIEVCTQFSLAAEKLKEANASSDEEKEKNINFDDWCKFQFDDDDDNGDGDISILWTDLNLQETIRKQFNAPPKIISVTSFFSQILLTETDTIRKLDNAVLIIRSTSNWMDRDLLIESVSMYKVLRNPSMRRILIGKNLTRFKMNDDIVLSQIAKESLKFLTSSGNEGQLAEIEHIDKTKSLSGKVTNPILDGSHTFTNMMPQLSKKKHIRVFIWADFINLERTVLRKIVFPALRKMANKLHVNLYEVELNGNANGLLKESDIMKIRSEEICRSDIFIVIIGREYLAYNNAYGQSDKLSSSDNCVSSTTEFDKICEILKQYDHLHNNTHIFLRQEESHVKDITKNVVHSNRTNLLHQMVLNSSTIKEQNIHFYNEFKCLAQSVLDCTWTSLIKMQMIASDIYILAEIQTASNKRIDIINNDFVSRKYDDICREASLSIQQPGMKIAISGDSGSGKTFLACRCLKHWINNSSNTSTRYVTIPIFTDVFRVHILSSSLYQSNYQRVVLTYICHLMNQYIDLPFNFAQATLPTKMQIFKNIRLICNTAKKLSVIFLICIDSIDNVMDSEIADLIYKSFRSCASMLITFASQNNGKITLLENNETLKRIDLSDGLDMYSKRQILRRSFEKIDNTVVRIISNKQDCKFPIFLKIVCRYIQMFKNVADELEKIAPKIPQNLPSLVSYLLDSIAVKYNDSLNIKILVALLVNNKHMSDNELGSMLYLDKVFTDVIPKKCFAELVSDFTKEKLYPTPEFLLTFYSVLSDLDWMLGTRYKNTYVYIHHHIMAESLLDVLSQDIVTRSTFIYAFYTWLCCYSNDTWSDGDGKSMVELPKLLMQANRIADLEYVLNSSSYLSHRCSHGYIDDLLIDFKKAVELCPSLVKMNNMLQKNQNVLRMYPNEFYNILVEKKIQMINEGTSLIDHIHSHKYAILAMKVCNDIVALGCSDGVIKLISLKGRNCIAEMTGHSAPVNCLTFCGSDDMLLASGSYDCNLCFWSCNRSVRIKLYRNHRLQLTDVILTARNELVASSDLEGCICTYSSRSLAFVNRWFVENKSPISCLQDHKDDQLLLVLTWADILYIYEPYNGECRQKYDFPWATQISSLSYNKFLTLTGNQTVVFNYCNPYEQVSFASIIQRATCFSLLDDNNKICVGHSDGSVSLYKLTGPKQDSRTFKYVKFIERIAASSFGLIISQTNGLIHVFRHHYPSTPTLNPLFAQGINKPTGHCYTYGKIKGKPVNIVDICVHSDITTCIYKPGDTIAIQCLNDYICFTPGTPFLLKNLLEIKNASQIVHRVLTQKQDDQFIMIIFIKCRNSIVIQVHRVTHSYKISDVCLMKYRNISYSSSQIVFIVADSVKDAKYLYFVISDDHSLNVYYWDVEKETEELICSQLIRANHIIKAISIFDDGSHDACIITLCPDFENANISWWSLNRTDCELTLLQTIKLTSDPPLNLFGNLLILKDGTCKKYSTLYPYNMLWQCSVELGKKLAYSPGHYDPLSNSTINEKLYTVIDGHCVSYSFPPMTPILSRCNFHRENVSAVYINDDYILSSSYDGNLIMYPYRKTYSLEGEHVKNDVLQYLKNTKDENVGQVPVSIYANIEDTIAKCVLLFPYGNIIIWTRKINDNEWKRTHSINSNISDATHAYFSYSCLHIITTQGFHYFSTNFKYFEKTDDRQLIPLLPLFTSQDKSNVYMTSHGKINEISQHTFKIYRDFYPIAKLKRYYSRVWLLPDEILFLSLDHSMIDIVRRDHENKDSGCIYLENLSFDEDQQQIKILNNMCIAVFCENGYFYILIADIEGYLHKIQVDQKTYNIVETTHSTQSIGFNCIQYTKKSNLIWTGSSNYVIQVWNCKDLSQVKEYTFFTAGIPLYIENISEQSDEVIVCCRNGDVFAVNYNPYI